MLLQKKTIIDECDGTEKVVLSYTTADGNNGMTSVPVSYLYTSDDNINNIATEVAVEIANQVANEVTNKKINENIPYITNKVIESIPVADGTNTGFINSVSYNSIFNCITKKDLFMSLLRNTYTNMVFMSWNYSFPLNSYTALDVSNIESYNLYGPTYDGEYKYISDRYERISNIHLYDYTIYDKYTLSDELEYCYNNNKYILQFSNTTTYLQPISELSILSWLDNGSDTMDNMKFYAVISYTTIEPNSENKLFLITENKFSTIYDNYCYQNNDKLNNVNNFNIYSDFYKNNVEGKDNFIYAILSYNFDGECKLNNNFITRGVSYTDKNIQNRLSDFIRKSIKTIRNNNTYYTVTGICGNKYRTYISVFD